MTSFIIRRTLQVIPVLFAIAILVFGMLHFIPGDPARLVVGIEASKETVEAARENLGLNNPIYIQFLTFIGNALQGDLGTSIQTGIPVTEELATRFPITITIALGATIFATVFGMLGGVLAAIKQNKFTDNFIMFISLIAVSIPSYFLGLILLMIFSLKLGWFPVFGVDSPKHYILPIVTLGAQSMGLIARMTRSSMLDVVRQDYIRTAKAKGLPERVITYIHALKNALIPVVTVIGLRFGGLLAGTILTEVVFSIPGVGRYMVDAILARDYPIVQGTILVVATTFVIINIFVDIAYKIVDPRIRYE
ncbi:ABC transporter permease [Ornithinibacillus sp. 4-3]|uniref:ABC transporter permease n=1 Tax=Ornithinibacillus sp. 4-3 TaxID=3231488 RepID=A0AB39HIK3_9BACI